MQLVHRICTSPVSISLEYAFSSQHSRLAQCARPDFEFEHLEQVYYWMPAQGFQVLIFPCTRLFAEV
jgi:hypothetical protein